MNLINMIWRYLRRKRKEMTAETKETWDEKTKKQLEKINTSYDNHLNKIKHYTIHPEMMPFVGFEYDKMQKKILLVGESHYLNQISHEDGEKPSFDFSNEFSEINWYEMNFDTIKSNYPKSGLAQQKSYVYTRNVVCSFLAGYPGVGYGIFHTPLTAIHDVLNKNDFNEFAFMNYFQKPAYKFGESIKKYIDDNDKKIAFDTLVGVVKSITPTKIIILSSTVRDRLNELLPESERFIEGVPVYYTCHPTCAWWRRNDGKHGKKAFITAYNA